MNVISGAPYNNTLRKSRYTIIIMNNLNNKIFVGVFVHWTGLLDWNTGLDYWTEFLDRLPMEVYFN